MKLGRTTFLLVLMIVLEKLCFAQAVKPELAVVREFETNAAETMKIIKTGKGDTAQARLMIKAMRIYYNNLSEGRHELDTAFSIAKNTYTLSRKLHFKDGIAEAAFVMAKVRTKQKNPEAAIRYLGLVNGESKARLLLVIAEYYTFNFESGEKEFIKALPLIDQAQRICKSINSFRWLAECQVLLGKYYLKNGELEKGKRAFSVVIDRYEKLKEFGEAAKTWSRLGNTIPENAANFLFIKKCHEQAIKDFLLDNDKENMAYTLRDLADLNAVFYHADTAEVQFLKVVSTLKSINAPVKFSTWNRISSFYRFLGKNNKALYYALEARKAIDFNDYKRIQSAEMLALIYMTMDKKELSLKYFLEVYKYKEPMSTNDLTFNAVSIAVTRSQIGKTEAKKGLMFLDDFVKKHPPANAINKQNLAYAYGEIYTAMGDYAKAEACYKQMMSLDNDAAKVTANDISSIYHIHGGGAAMIMGRFYAKRGQFAESRPYLIKALKDTIFADVQQIRDARFLLFRADSAVQNYLPAIKNLQRYNAMNDSINNVVRNNQFDELNLKYETVEKEKNIKNLESKQKLQNQIIERSDTIKGYIISLSVLLLLLFIITFIAFRLKQRSNKNLTSQRQLINEKNSSLEILLNEKDNFLKEKDWLLKEVHHRVKNNLQIIISLLDTQSVYLENNVALEAIQESQNRVHSIALIHQRLYRSDNPGSISLPEYVSDLIENLSQGFNASNRKIIFEHHIELLDIDLSQAVPLGLILNESITNAIKYAFTGSGGKILVTVNRLDGERVKLSVNDNGVGLPENFDINRSNSLGMELMKGLSKQLRGEFGISGVNGVQVSVEFELLKSLML